MGFYRIDKPKNRKSGLGNAALAFLTVNYSDLVGDPPFWLKPNVSS